jgi:hypothetical protein
MRDQGIAEQIKARKNSLRFERPAQGSKKLLVTSACVD